MDDLNSFLSVFVFILGALLGSFFNVCIVRMPKEESIIFPASHCPNCKKSIPFYLNIPIVSYLWLRGKARCCGVRISIRYFIIELLTASLSLILFLFYSHSNRLPIQSAMGCMVLLSLIVVTVIDLEHLIIPDEISVGGTLLGLLFSFIWPSMHGESSHWWSLGQSALGILAGGGTLWAVACIGEKILKKEAMGMGDVKLMSYVGAVAGWKMAFLTIFLGSLLGAIISLIFIFTKRLQRQSQIPFGPFLSLGVWISFLFGEKLINWYWGFVSLP